MPWIWQHPDWPALTWREAALAASLADVRHAQGVLFGEARALGVLETAPDQVEPVVLDALGTSAIEGEHPDPQSVRSSVLRRLDLPTAGLPAPPRSTDGLVAMLLDATQRFDEPLSAERLFRWHAGLFPRGRSGGRPIVAGRYRGAGPMRVVSGVGDRQVVHYEAPPADAVPAEMTTFLPWFGSSRANTDGLIRAAVAHVRFLTVHPFDDGNGRIARALTDLALAQTDRLPVRLQSLSARIMDVRDAYYEELESAQRGGPDVTCWIAWFLEQIRVSAVEATERLDAIRARRGFWDAHRGAPLNERQRKALARMLEELPAEFEGGMTNRKYVSLTGCSRATAQRDLEQLVAWRCLAPVGAGRSRGYVLVRAGG